MIELPTLQKPQVTHPNLLLCSGQPGVGKSTLIAGLNVNGYKACHLDLQGGAKGVGGYIIDVKEIAEKNDWPLARALKESIKTIRQANIENGSPVFDFIAIDPLSNLKEVIIGLAARIFNDSTVGRAHARKQAEGIWGINKYNAEQLESCKSKDPVADIGQNGWNFYNMAWKEIFGDLTTLAGKCTIFLAHTKYNTLKKSEINEVSVREIDFWPSYLLELIGTASDSASLYRKDNQVIASFILNDNHSHFKSRHFDGQEIVLSTKTDKGIEVHWEKIFPFLTEKKK